MKINLATVCGMHWESVTTGLIADSGGGFNVWDTDKEELVWIEVICLSGEREKEMLRLIQGVEQGQWVKKDVSNTLEVWASRKARPWGRKKQGVSLSMGWIFGWLRSLWKCPMCSYRGWSTHGLPYNSGCGDTLQALLAIGAQYMFWGERLRWIISGGKTWR